MVLPGLGYLALLDVFVLLSAIPLLGHRHNGGVNDLATAGLQTLFLKISIKPLEEFCDIPACLSRSLNNATVVASGMDALPPSPQTSQKRVDH